MAAKEPVRRGCRRNACAEPLSNVGEITLEDLCDDPNGREIGYAHQLGVCFDNLADIGVAFSHGT